MAKLMLVFIWFGLGVFQPKTVKDWHTILSTESLIINFEQDRYPKGHNQNFNLGQGESYVSRLNLME